jgi:hypothetical protein
MHRATNSDRFDVMHPAGPPAYNLGFTAASLRPELARIVAESYLLERDWSAAKARVLTSNQLQNRSRSSAVRQERELRQRLQKLSDNQLSLLARGGADDRASMAWLAALKHLPFVFDFAAGILREKLALRDPVLRPSDYETYVDRKAILHPELGRLTASSKSKIRQVLLRMLLEAGLLRRGDLSQMIQRSVLSRAALETIAADDARWLAGFLVPDFEIRELGFRGTP